MVKAISPAKLIISGEHAVVYGNPALAMTVDRFINVEANLLERPILSLEGILLPNTQIHMHDALNHYQVLQSRYERYLNHHASIEHVSVTPYDLVLFSTFQALQANQLVELNTGLRLKFESRIPVGCGLGSSAATICAIIYAVMKISGIQPNSDIVFPLALNAEHLQHGRSSGLDIKTVLTGGSVLFDKNNQKKRVLPSLPFYLVNTGRPLSSTGECVSQAQIFFKRPRLLDTFAEVTRAIDEALSKNNTDNLIQAMRKNHQLLCQIGVVPLKVQQFIATIEQLGGSAKICGAGSVKGDAGGMCLVICNKPIEGLCLKYGYEIEIFKGINQGVYLSSASE